ncbi:MAG: hypothetical protein JWO73_127 [Candidatus Taylorbacteria bacterium]|nr:hypothetical protein [Candidatus Taylorbacteria bacterium]
MSAMKPMKLSRIKFDINRKVYYKHKRVCSGFITNLHRLLSIIYENK